MRFIIYGAGGIGGTIGCRLFQHGYSVILIARGGHFEAMRQKGVIFKSPVETVTLPIPCVRHPSEIKFQAGDIVIMTMKSHHTLEALEALRIAAGEDVSVICCQNGVANESMAARRFNRVYGMAIFLPATHLEPGVVQTEAQNGSAVRIGFQSPCRPTDHAPEIRQTVDQSEQRASGVVQFRRRD
jgi:2-dehydropantoate 2-reductase